MIAPGEAGIPLTNVNVEEDDSNGKEAEVRIWINLNIILFFCTNYFVIVFSIFILLHRILRTRMPVMGFLIILVQYLMMLFSLMKTWNHQVMKIVMKIKG